MFFIIFIVFFFLPLFFFLEFFFFSIFFKMPDWWYTHPLIDWPIRQVLLGIRWCYRKTIAGILSFWRCNTVKTLRLVLDIPALYSWVKWYVCALLVKPFPHLYVKVGRRSYVVVVAMLHDRVYFVAFFCLLLLYFKRSVFFLRASVVSFHRRLYSNFIVSFLFGSPQPLSFLKFTFMLVVLVCFGWALFRLISLSYANFFALLFFFGVTLSFNSDFLFVFFSFSLCLFFFLFLEFIARLFFVVFLKVFGLSRGTTSFLVFFLAFVFLFFVSGWLIFLWWPVVTANLGVNFLGIFLFLFFLTDFFCYYAYRLLWAEQQSIDRHS